MGAMSDLDNGQERIDIGTFAARTGVTSDAIRKRIKRGELPATKIGGRWYVLWASPTGQAESGSGPDRCPDPNPDPSRLNPDSGPDGQNPAVAAQRELIDTVRAENARLWQQIEVKDRELEAKERQIQAWIEEAQRKDLLLAHLNERIIELPTLATKQQPPSDATTASREAANGASESSPVSSPRSWWQRLFNL